MVSLHRQLVRANGTGLPSVNYELDVETMAILNIKKLVSPQLEMVNVDSLSSNRVDPLQIFDMSSKTPL